MSGAKRNDKGKNTQLEQKLSRLREKQEKWMEERATTDKGSSKKTLIVHSSLKPYASSVSSVNDAPKQKKDAKKVEPLLWTAGTSNSKYNGFVVRNGSGNSNSRQNSAREHSATKISSNKKTYTHSSLRDQPSRPTSAKSSNFVQSSKRNKEMKSEEEDDYAANDKIDDSLSESFSEKFQNFQIENEHEYNFKRYEETTKSSSQKACTNVNSKSADKGPFMENHYCSACKELMYDEKHVPLMVFPCGHSFCSSCISGRSTCQSCNCDILSTEENHSLHAIISKFKKKQEREELEQKEKRVRKYLEEYNNLNTRIDLMKGEANNVIDEMENITHQLIEKRDTVKHIEENSVKIKRQQEMLQCQLKDLENQREQEVSSMDNLEVDYDNQKKQLHMLEKTIKSIKHNKEKVKQYVKELLPSSVSLLQDDESN